MAKRGQTFKIQFLALNPGQSHLTGLLEYFYYGTAVSAKNKAKLLTSRIPNIKTDATITQVSVGPMTYGDFPVIDKKVIE